MVALHTRVCALPSKERKTSLDYGRGGVVSRGDPRRPRHNSPRMDLPKHVGEGRESNAKSTYSVSTQDEKEEVEEYDDSGGDANYSDEEETSVVSLKEQRRQERAHRRERQRERKERRGGYLASLPSSIVVSMVSLNVCVCWLGCTIDPRSPLFYSF